jgi:hypothetical protein
MGSSANSRPPSPVIQQLPPASGASLATSDALVTPCFVGSHGARRHGRAGLRRLGFGHSLDHVASTGLHSLRDRDDVGRPEPLHAQHPGHLERAPLGPDRLPESRLEGGE